MTRQTVPQKWLWRLAVEDAIEAGFTIEALDKASGKSVKIDLSAERSKEKLTTRRGNLEIRMRELGAVPLIRLCPGE
ncbi:hypothetical protein [Sphingomicrobium nitratireducens]|uniref:hypothetical protein n=1 Tax=Sphingomicrobium nitratireducens TaxID=2964666 RepID=UPI00224056E2|nr:hypothetical protein [Sphingomicrobium nitratireducens]